MHQTVLGYKLYLDLKDFIDLTNLFSKILLTKQSVDGAKDTVTTSSAEGEIPTNKKGFDTKTESSFDYIWEVLSCHYSQMHSDTEWSHLLDSHL